MIQEIWKDIENYKGLYQVSSQGRVKSLNYKHTGKEKVLKSNKNKNGYLQIYLCKDEKVKSFLIHRLVSQAFIPNPENKPSIDHINTIRDDNRVENLRWVTHKENMNNPLSIKKVKGINNYNAKPILQFTLDGELIKKWSCAKDAERELGFNNGHISSCCSGKRKTTNGYIWRYYDLELYLESKLFKAFNIKNKLVA